MQLKLTITSKLNILYSEINKYFIQSFIWTYLKNTSFSKLHDLLKFKFFSFSNTMLGV